jgi:hypothetical protein
MTLRPGQEPVEVAPRILTPWSEIAARLWIEEVRVEDGYGYALECRRCHEQSGSRCSQDTALDFQLLHSLCEEGAIQAGTRHGPQHMYREGPGTQRQRRAGREGERPRHTATPAVSPSGQSA